MADAAGDIDMAPLQELIEIRREQAHIREFQAKADEKKAEVDSLVFQRVLDDYNKRHDALETRAAPLKMRARKEYQKLRAKRDATHATHEDARLAKQELEFRRMVGELSDAELTERLTAPEQTLATTSEELAALDALKGRFIEGFGSEAELDLPPPPKPAPLSAKPAPTAVVAPPSPPLPNVAETERLSGRTDTPSAPGASPYSPGAGPNVGGTTGAGAGLSEVPAAAAASTVWTEPPPSEGIVSQTLMGWSRLGVATSPAPDSAVPPAAASPAPAPEAVVPTRIVTEDQLGSTAVQSGYVATRESPATITVPVAVLVGPQNGDASGAGALPHRLGSSTYIGRSEESHIRVQRPSVSRQHALVAAGPAGFTIQDLHSQNGTYINGERIREQAPLQDGDRVTLGDAEFVFQFLKSDSAG